MRMTVGHEGRWNVKATCGAVGATVSSFLVLFADSTVIRADAVLSGTGVFTTIDFAGFDASGFVPTPAAGQFDSDTWRVTGLSDGDLSETA